MFRRRPQPFLVSPHLSPTISGECVERLGATSAPDTIFYPSNAQRTAAIGKEEHAEGTTSKLEILGRYNFLIDRCHRIPFMRSQSSETVESEFPRNEWIHRLNLRVAILRNE